MLRVIRRKLKRWRRRRTQYADPRSYWEKRGEIYRREHRKFDRKGSAGDNTAEFIIKQLLTLNPQSVLEVGCGYGPLILRMQQRLGVPIFGVDFSSTQLREAQLYLGQSSKCLVRADAAFLPFDDGAFDAVLTSGVLMHIYLKRLPKVIQELARVAKQWLVHNEDVVRSFHGFGHDVAKVYADLGYKVKDSFPNPCGLEKQKLQFVIVDLQDSI